MSKGPNMQYHIQPYYGTVRLGFSKLLIKKKKKKKENL